ncbi:hypothetical protein [Flagellimonas sp. GZD32]|uniref:hypothetical protein n=1 Tax=Flagellimonas cixiensis TaxID=3228750 RepID=UPI0035C928A9
MKLNISILLCIAFCTLLCPQLLAQENLCARLQQMVELDQKYRGTNDSILKRYNLALDSILKAKGLTYKEFNAMPALEQGKLKSLAFKIGGKNMQPIMANDSLANIQHQLDHQNTIAIIELVNEHGWLTDKNLGCSQKIRPVLIFRHAPKKYWPQIRELIEKEREAQRIPPYEYYVIDNHLKGRPPLDKSASDFKNR